MKNWLVLICFLVKFSTNAQNSIFENYSNLPIKPERTISFTTTEGSYMNVDLSPDGKWLLFDVLGDIHLVPSNGGKTRQLTHGLALKLRPIWFPDGKAFSYISDVNGDFSSYKQPINGNGSAVFYSSDISKHETHQVRSPDGRYLASVKLSDGNPALYLFDSVKNVTKVLIPLLQNLKAYGRYLNLPRFVFSPDSKSIYIGYSGKIHQVFVETGKDKVIPFVATIKTELGALVHNQFPISHDSIQIKHFRSVSKRLDGKQLVFSSQGKIYTMGLPNGKPKILVEQDANQFQPAYSSDGKWITYVSWNDLEGGQVWRVSSNGGVAEQLTTVAGHYQRPAWSPDGQWIAVIRAKPKLNDMNDPGWGSLELIPTKGGQPTKLSDSIPLWNHLTFSKNSKRIFFQPKFKIEDSIQSGYLLVAKNLDGTSLEVIAEGAEDVQIKQRALSPDGKWLAYSLGEDIYLLPAKSGKLQLSASNPKAIKIGAGVDPVWDLSGKKMSWTYGDHFYTAECQQTISNVKNIRIADSVKLHITTESKYGKGIVAIKGARIITMKGSEVIENGVILIRNGRILKIGKIGQFIIPKGARIHEANGKTIIPGLIDTHLHMRVSPDIFPQQSWMFLANLAYGVTTARDPALNFDSFGYSEQIQSGKMIGPRLFSVGKAVSLDNGAVVKIDNFEDARDVLKKRLIMGATFVKQYDLPTRKQRQWLLLACKEFGLNMTNEGEPGIFGHIAMIKDGSSGIEHDPIWGDVYDDVIKLFAYSGTFFTPTLQVSKTSESAKEYFKYKFWKIPNDKMRRFIKSDTSRPFATMNGPESLENILNTIARDTLNPSFLKPANVSARMINAGAKIAIGSHGNDQGIGVHNEIWALQMGGCSNFQVLKTATIIGAQALGLQNDLGSLEVGKIADLIILNGNPLESIQNTKEIQYVMKDGVLYEGNTLDQIWPQVKKCPEWKLKTK